MTITPEQIKTQIEHLQQRRDFARHTASTPRHSVTLCGVVAALRAAHRISRHQVCEITYRPETQYREVEMGMMAFSAAEVLAVCRLAGVSVDEAVPLWVREQIVLHYNTMKANNRTRPRYFMFHEVCKICFDDNLSFQEFFEVLPADEFIEQFRQATMQLQVQADKRRGAICRQYEMENVLRNAYHDARTKGRRYHHISLNHLEVNA